MNVLIYNGPGALAECVEHTLNTLSTVLEPFYAVNTISNKALLSEPWMTKTAALVFPGGDDALYTKECRPAFAEIQKFVRERRGLFIGISGGAYLASSRCEFCLGDPDHEIAGKRDLQFFFGTARGPAFPGFKDKRTVGGGQIVNLKVDDGTMIKSYYNAGPAFISTEEHEKVEVLAKYADKDTLTADGIQSSGDAATILCQVGKGRALLMGSHPEFVPDLMAKHPQKPYDADLVESLQNDYDKTLEFIRYILHRCGLKVNDGTHINKLDLTPVYMSYDEKEKSKYDVFRDNLKMYRNSEDSFFVRCATDDFDILEGYCNKKVDSINNKNNGGLSEPTKLMVIPSEEENVVPSCCTPKFDVAKYFEHRSPTTKLGSILMYCEVIESTSKLLDLNKTLLSMFPDDSVVCSASQQNQGVGRRGNIWLSPDGSYSSTVSVTFPTVSPTTRKPISIIFIQYLGVLALIKTMKTLAPGYENIPVKIKWPNDLYILNPKYYRASKNIDILNMGKIPVENDGEPSYAKCGGVSVNMSLKEGKYNVLVGTGCNLKNDNAPSVSVQMWVDIINEELKNRGAPEKDYLVDVEHEKFLALHLHYMSEFFEKFVKGGSASFLPEYYSHWLHSSQIIKLTDHDSVRAKVTGITEDYGLLVARELVPGSDVLTNSNCYHLQPDGNTFDMFRGLISKKYV